MDNSLKIERLHGIDIMNLPEITEKAMAGISTDWMAVKCTQKAEVYRNRNSNEIILTNGLISRRWRIEPNLATVSYDNLITGESIIRGIKPEAIVELDGTKYEVGGLMGQEEYAYLKPEWVDLLKNNEEAFFLTGIEVGETKERFPWMRRRYCQGLPWPAPGASIAFTFEAPGQKHKGIEVLVHYEMYDGIPLISKWITVNNKSGREVKLNTLFLKYLLW